MDRAHHLGEPVVRIARAAVVVALVLAPSVVAAEGVAPATRDVSPPGITPPAITDGPLVRVPVPPPPPDPPRWRRFFLPATADAATFTVGALSIHIAGVSPVAPGAICQDTDGTSWPCGQTALFSFRRFLHGRPVECYMAPPADAKDIAAACRIGTVDLGAWLLTAGWAKAGAGATDAYRSDASAAACAGVGIWRGAARPAGCPANTTTAAN
jgi:endonuclease YncB( thermonuclease family)